jgi:phosphatidylethanolamine-binding protein (PEBP) family uncharacterized protein
MLALALPCALAACGSGSGARGTATIRSASSAASPAPATPGGSAQKPDLATIFVTSVARMPNGRLAPQYTCEGADISPSLTWSGVSPGSTKEVVVLVRTLTLGSLQTNWVVAGIDPRIDHLDPGTLPAGAVVGRNSSGEARYSLCPPRNKAAIVVLAVLALPRRLGLKQGFDMRAIEPLVGRPDIPWGSITIAAGARAAARR